MDFEPSIGDQFVIGKEEHLVSTLYREGQVSDRQRQSHLGHRVGENDDAFADSDRFQRVEPVDSNGQSHFTQAVGQSGAHQERQWLRRDRSNDSRAETVDERGIVRPRLDDDFSQSIKLTAMGICATDASSESDFILSCHAQARNRIPPAATPSIQRDHFAHSFRSRLRDPTRCERFRHPAADSLTPVYATVSVPLPALECDDPQSFGSR